ncbi:MAG: radical protein, partial [Desulfacinum sp.]|nr:radical protein [Desulfacinum sp.]
MEPLYLDAYRSGRLQKRIERALGWLKKCALCPRLCRVDRLK